MLIFHFLLGFLVYITINYVIYSTCVYLDYRYKMEIAECTTPTWHIIPIFLFGFVHIFGIIIVLAICVSQKLNYFMQAHKRLAELGKKTQRASK